MFRDDAHKHETPHLCGVLFDTIDVFGGYGWTRTTDPSIMSAVL